jgi:hypothetical protein
MFQLKINTKISPRTPNPTNMEHKSHQNRPKNLALTPPYNPLFSLKKPNPQFDEIGRSTGIGGGGEVDIIFDIANCLAIEVAAAVVDQPPAAMAVAGAGENARRRVQWRRLVHS